MRTRILLVIALFTPQFVLAQGAINLVSTPEFPTPNSQITLKLSSYAVDLGASKIIWYLDGKPTKQGFGITEAQFETGDIGNKTEITAVIMNNMQGKMEQKVTIIPTYSDLLWEADTYVPPFYKGKALPTHRSLVRTTIIPNAGDKGAPEGINYKWTVNRTLGLGTGINKSFAAIETGWPKSTLPLKVSGESTLAPGMKFGGQISLPSRNPIIRFYEVTPLTGVDYGREISKNYTLTGDTAKVRAVPYFVSKTDYTSRQTEIVWSVNSSRVDPEGPYGEYLTLKKLANTPEQTIAYRFQNTNTNRLLQKATGLFKFTTKS